MARMRRSPKGARASLAVVSHTLNYQRLGKKLSKMLNEFEYDEIVDLTEQELDKRGV